MSESHLDTAGKAIFPTAAVIENRNPSYVGDGNKQVDKISETTYTNEAQSVTVESYFVGTDSIHNLLKRFLQEQFNAKSRVANIVDLQYNCLGNTVVAASTKEDVK